QVYEDEIRHVATGLVWFTRWSEGDRLQAWEDALVPPLTVARARGRGFDAEGRARAGFTAPEIERLRVVGGSRGRPPRVLAFDAAVEDRVAGRAPGPMAARVTRDLAVLPLFLAGAEDVVVARPPSTAFLTRLADAGIEVPRFVPEATREALGPHRPHSYVPWGATPLPEPDLDALHPGSPWDPRWAALSSKSASARRARELWSDPRGLVDEPGGVWTEVMEPGDGPWVIKAPFSTSGTARLRGQGPLDARQRVWVERTLARDGEVLWQPWYERVVDVSTHVTVLDEGVRLDGCSRFLTASAGAYRGAVLGLWTRDLDRDVLRAVHDRSAGPCIRERLEEAAREAGRWAHALGYRGPLSLDAAIVREHGALRVHPWLETNARSTLGRVALALGGRTAPQTPAVWRVERHSAALASALLEATLDVGPEGWRSGVLPTNDPATADVLLTWVEVGGVGVALASPE
ncbi:MAG: hypothetical protein KC656_00575, partial [Myxococcales bacterium]|nr:hypothetical protein [Myxococcales bacterium]